MLDAVVAFWLAAAPVAAATENPAASASTSIDDAAWLAGRWIGTGLGGDVEEVWSPPRGGQMVGHFALVRDGQPEFYELMLVDVVEAGVRMRVKHFNRDFTAWEDRGGWHTFEPRSVEPGIIRMSGLVLRRDGDELLVTITIRERSGAVQEHKLRLRRAPL